MKNNKAAAKVTPAAPAKKQPTPKSAGTPKGKPATPKAPPTPADKNKAAPAKDKKVYKQNLSDLQSFLGAPPSSVTKFQKMSLKELEKVPAAEHMVAIKWYMMNQAARTVATAAKEQIRLDLNKERASLVEQLRTEIRREIRDSLPASYQTPVPLQKLYSPPEIVDLPR